MTKDNKINDNNRFDVGFFQCPDTGKYITLKLTQDEFRVAMAVKMDFQKNGIKIPITGVVRKMMQVGTDNIDMEALKANPMSIFTQLNHPVPTVGEAA